MRPLLTASCVFLGLLLAGAVASARPATFTSRVPYEPLVAKLKASGGSEERIIHVERAADLDRLDDGRRYKFVVDARGRLAVAPLAVDAPANEYVHPILAGGGPVLTAGGIRVEHANGRIVRIVVDQESHAYCPTSESLSEAVRALTAVGIDADVVQREDKPPKCVGR